MRERAPPCLRDVPERKPRARLTSAPQNGLPFPEHEKLEAAQPRLGGALLREKRQVRTDRRCSGPLNATSGRFARLDTEIGTLTVMNGRLSQSEYVVRPLDAIDGCLSQRASAISNPGKAGCAMMRADTAGVSARKHPSGSHRETGGAFPPQTFRRHGGTVRPTLRRSEANGPSVCRGRF